MQVCLFLTLVSMPFQQYSVVSKGVLLLPLLAVGAVFLAGWERLMNRRLPVLVVLFTLWTGGSLMWSADRRGSAVALSAFAAAVVLALCSAWLLTLDQVARTVLWSVQALIAVTVLSLLLAPEWSTAPPVLDPVSGWHGPFSHKNGLGAFLVLAVVTLGSLPCRRRGLWLGATAVLLVGARSSTALAISAIVVLVLLWAKGLVRQHLPAGRLAYVTVSALVTGVAVSAVTLAPGLIANALGRNLTLTGRTEIWGAVEHQIALRPVNGFGWGGVWRATSPPTLQMWREARFNAYYAHNGYLDVLLQVGAVGLVLLLAIIAVTAVRLTNAPATPVTLWSLLVLGSLCISAFSESAPFTDALGLLLITVLGVSTCQRRSPTRQAGRRPHVPATAMPPSGAMT